LSLPHSVKARLPRTWEAFFGRHGNFTAIQLQAIPALLDGENVVLCGGTGSGKTEAALAPLIERHLPPQRPTPRLRLLILVPTRALINDLAARLTPALDRLRVTVAIKNHDVDTFNPRHPNDLLLTTPESLDSLLAGAPKSLIHIQAMVIDELHALDSTARGDQLRILIRRLQALRDYAARQGDTDHAVIQFAALSATLTQPELRVGQYYSDARIIEINHQRPIHAELIPLDEGDGTSRALIDCLNTFRPRKWKKALVFCNTRAEVEHYAGSVVDESPFGHAVFVHYSNLTRERRAEIETGFAQAEAAICFTSSTLELGIDIGSVDAVLLIGAPGNPASFVQRVGRASRRTSVVQAICFYRSPLEYMSFQALLSEQSLEDHASVSFRPSVAIQQIFSLLKASPTGGIRLAPTATLLAGMLSPQDVEALLGQLQAVGYLKTGRPGEWRAGERLNRLVDAQQAEHTPFSLYSNIQNTGNALKIRDQTTHRIIAHMDGNWLDRETLLLEGRPLHVRWREDDELWVSASQEEQAAQRSHYPSPRPLLSFDLAQRFPAVLGLTPERTPIIAVDDGWVWFHWLGEVYGKALLDLLGYKQSVEKTSQPGLCCLFKEAPQTLPAFSAMTVTRYLHDHYRRYEAMLALGMYQTLLPVALRQRAVSEVFDVARFVTVVNRLHLEWAADTITESLNALLEPRHD
jgi:ATP-dependent Lhr-like helicase